MLKRLDAFKKGLGSGNPRHLIASSALFSVILFFYLLSITSLFQPIVYPFIDRITYPSYFEDKYFVNYIVDSLIIILCTLLWVQFCVQNKKKYFVITAFGLSLMLSLSLSMESAIKIISAISLPTILVFIIIDKIFKKNIVTFNLKLTVNYISISAISIAITSSFALSSYLFFPELPLPSWNYIYLFFIIISIFSPIYLTLISFGYPLGLILSSLKKRLRRSFSHNQEFVNLTEKYLKRRTRIFLFFVIISLAITVSMIPHLRIVDEDNRAIGSDTKYYVRFLETIAQSSGYEDVLYKAFVTVVGGDRPLSLLFFFWLSTTFYQSNFFLSLEYVPVLLSPLLVISIYFLTFSITRNHLTSLFASLITIPSHMLIGIYAGLYANWFALIWGYLAMLFLFRLTEKQKKIDVIVFSVLLVVLLFSHAQTWTIFMYVIGLFTAVLYFRNKRQNKSTAAYILFSILPSIVIDVLRMLLINFSGVSQELSFAMKREVGIHGIAVIWDNLIDTAHLYLAGQIANPIILLLVIYWLYNIKIKANYVIFLGIFFSLYIFPLLFADATIQARFFYEIPFQIPAAIALTVLKERTGSYLAFTICVWLAVMSLYTAANFVLIVPEKYL